MANRGSDAEARAASQRRRSRSDQTLEDVLRPRSVAVVGASRTRGTPGAEILHNIRTGSYRGRLYAVNPHTTQIDGVSCVPSVTALPQGVDLVVVAVPAALTLDVARDCAAAGVGALLVISAGFAEEGAAGATLQADLLAVCRSAGMRLVGPNCMGVVNMDPAVRLNATFSPVTPRPGRLAVVSQSGGLGVAVMAMAAELSLGLSLFVSIGNRADVSANDVLDFVESDAHTDVVLLYVESFGNPRNFARIARRVSAGTPVVAVKGGRSAAGALATASHTGSLLAGSNANVDALFHQAGIIRADTLEELLDAGTLLAHYPEPKGPRVGIVANAGGLGVLAADACETAGLQTPELSHRTQDRLRKIRPTMATRNPIDTLPQATEQDLEDVTRALLDAGEVDTVVGVVVAPPEGDGMTARLLSLAAESPTDLPVVPVFVGAAGKARGNVVFGAPERAIRALGHAWAHRRWRDADHGSVPELDVDVAEVAHIVAAAVSAGGGWLDQPSVTRLLAAYRLPVIETRWVDTPEAAGRVAGGLGGPVAVKAEGPTLLHKSDSGAVVLGIPPDDVEAAARRMMLRLAAAGHRVDRVVVQRMADDGVELIVGVVHDATFGPILACGAGGVLTELLNDVAIRLTPVTDVEAASMLRELRTYPLLTGYRGSPPLDIEAVVDVVLRVGRLADDHPCIAELDCNPVVVTTTGPVVVDARIRVSPNPGTPGDRPAPGDARQRAG